LLLYSSEPRKGISRVPAKAAIPTSMAYISGMNSASFFICPGQTVILDDRFDDIAPQMQYAHPETNHQMSDLQMAMYVTDMEEQQAQLSRQQEHHARMAREQAMQQHAEMLRQFGLEVQAERQARQQEQEQQAQRERQREQQSQMAIQQALDREGQRVRQLAQRRQLELQAQRERAIHQLNEIGNGIRQQQGLQNEALVESLGEVLSGLGLLQNEYAGDNYNENEILATSSQVIQ